MDLYRRDIGKSRSWSSRPLQLAAASMDIEVRRSHLSRCDRVHKLIDVAHEIVESTFDGYCCSVDDLIVGDKTVDVVYEYHCWGEYGHRLVLVPIEWFDEGFDYEAAYKELKRKEEKKIAAAEKKRKAAAKKAAAEKAKKEHETYLKLKKKFG